MPISAQPLVKAPCPDCGHAPVNHFVEKMNATIERIRQPFSFQFSFHPISPFFYHFNTIVPAFLKSLAAMHLGTIVREPDTLTGGRARCVWLEAKRRGIDMWEFRPFGWSQEIFVAKIPVSDGKKRHNMKTIIFDGLPRPAITLSGKKGLPTSLAWVDNKTFLKKKLANGGIPVAHGGIAFTWKRTKEIFGQLQQLQCLQKSNHTTSLASHPRVIIKPSTGSRSRHTTTGITNITELRHAFIKAKRLSPWVIIEEELDGQVCRGTIIGGKVVGIRRRDPPQVVGDSIHNLRELIEIENRRPERQGPMYWKIHIKEHIDLEVIPAKNHIISLSNKTSVYPGIGSTDVTDITHPDIIAIFEKIAVILDDQIVGVDFIVKDTAVPLSEQPHSGVIECNSLPFINLHLFPLNGKPHDTAAALWDVVVNTIG